MPVDPNISLGVKPMDLGQAPNVMDTVSRFADVQNKINQNKLFQQTYQARQEAGKIIAGAPDFETGLQLLGHSQYAPFMGEFLGQARGAMLALTQQQGEQQKQYGSGLAAALHGIAGGLTDPSMVGPAIDANLGAMPPEIRKQVEPYVRSVQKSLTDGLPKDPEAALAEYHKRVVAMGLSAGISPEIINTQLPSNEQIDLPGQVAFGQRAPRVSGGAFTPNGVINKGLAPQVLKVQNPDGSESTVVAGGGPSSGPGVIATGPTPSELALQGKKADVIGATVGDFSDMQQNLPNTMKQLDLMGKALTQFQAGGFATSRGELAQFAQGLKNMGMDIDDKTIEQIGNGSLKGTQLFQQQIRPFLVRQLADANKGNGRAVKSEIDSILNSADVTNDPQVLLEKINQARFKAQVGYDQAKRWPEFERLAEKKDPSLAPYNFDKANYYTWYNDHYGTPDKLPAQTGAGERLSPLQPTEVKGLAPQAGNVVEKGGAKWKFRGGDPSKKENWEKQ